MTKLIIVIWFIFSISQLTGQEWYHQNDSLSSYLCEKTNFSKIDNILHWRFKVDTSSKIDNIIHWRLIVDTSSKINHNDTITYIAEIEFYRSIPINNGKNRKLWTPRISFFIFNSGDSVSCRRISTRTRVLSSCLRPQVGGDLLFIGDFILLNNSVCLNCIRYKNKRDYCRPVLNNIFKEIDESKVTSIENLIEQIELKIDKE